MKYYGIKTPPDKVNDSYIWWIATDKYKCWDMFFQWPDKDGGINYSRAPRETAIRAYESIGYKCVELEIREKGEYLDGT